MAGSVTSAALRELITTFNDLNSAKVDEFDEEPSPLEFMRFVSRNTPFVDKNYHALNFEAKQETKLSNADAPTFSPSHNSSVISKPHEEEQLFEEFLSYVIRQETDQAFPQDAEVRYAQTQNDNFRNEYISLFSDAQKDIPFARIALQKDPDAINLWIGNSKSVTALHRDPMENIYVQVIGRKHFVLLPPVFHACVNEKLLLPATYARADHGLDLNIDQGTEPVPLATWDPDNPEVNPTELSHLVKPLHVTLNPGDMLYLPAMWYHKVKQSSNEEGCVVAINYWYDMEFGGPFYPLTSFVRNIGLGLPAISTSS